MLTKNDKGSLVVKPNTRYESKLQFQKKINRFFLSFSQIVSKSIFNFYRAIQIIKQNGRKMSDLINDQQSADGGSSLGGPLRFSNSIVFWLQSDQVS